MAIAPRGRFEDVVLGFVIVDEVRGEDGKVTPVIGTNWMTRQSFPVFVLNLIDYLGGGRQGLEVRTAVERQGRGENDRQ